MVLAIARRCVRVRAYKHVPVARVDHDRGGGLDPGGGGAAAAVAQGNAATSTATAATMRAGRVTRAG